VLLIIAVASITLILNVLIAVWLSNTDNLTIPSVGTIYVTGVEVYGGDTKSTNGIASIDWGTFYLTESKSASLYLRSVSNIPVKLAFNVTNWSPEGLAPYMTLSWNYTGTQIAPREEIPLSFTLSLSPTKDFINYLVTNNVTSFNFDLHIYALR
jgi:hypothetical protein